MCGRKRLSNPVLAHIESDLNTSAVMIWSFTIQYKSIPKYLLYPDCQNYFSYQRKLLQPKWFTVSTLIWFIFLPGAR